MMLPRLIAFADAHPPLIDLVAGLPLLDVHTRARTPGPPV